MSDRENLSNLFRYDLDDDKITQLTDFQTGGRSRGCWSEANQRLYYWRDQKIIEFDPETLEDKVIYEVPPDMEPEARANPSADGKYVISRLQEKIPEEKASISFAYSRSRETFHKKPLTQIVRVEVATGKMDIILEDNRYMTHINT
jgi:oligogalacturonide lyase